MDEDKVEVQDEGMLRTIKFKDMRVEHFWEFRLWISVQLNKDTARFLDAVVVDENGQPSADSVADIEALNNFVMVKSTTQWSYGAINEENLMTAVPLQHYNYVSVMMADLYLPFFQSNVSARQKLSSLLSREEPQSPANSSGLTTSMRQDGLPMSSPSEASAR